MRKELAQELSVHFRAEAATGLLHTVAEELDAAFTLQGSKLHELTRMAFPDFSALHDKRRSLQAHHVILGRDCTSQEKYDAYKNAIGGMKTNPSEFMFGLVIGTYPFLSTENDFPYNLPKDATHEVFWYRKDTSLQRLALYLTGYLLEKRIGESDFVVIKNTPAVRTIPSVEHVHLFLRS